MPKKIIVIFLLLSALGSLTSLHTIMTKIPNTALSVHTTFQTTASSQLLNDFVNSIKNGERNTVVGIYVPGKLALPIGQQPKGNAGYVTREPEKATQFAMASRFSTVGILAHNDLAGAKFSALQIENYAVVVYGDGHLAYYIIDEIEKFQALSPTSTFSDFINMDNPDDRLTAGELFAKVYGAGNRLVLQTCIAAHGDPSWGRMFIIGRPAPSQVMSFLQQTSLILEPMNTRFAFAPQ
jgi:hypothetical protein